MASSTRTRCGAWLWLLRGYLEPDAGRARELQQRALELARAGDDPDLELCALGDLGLTLVTQGRADEGLALIDEAMAGPSAASTAASSRWWSPPATC